MARVVLPLFGFQVTKEDENMGYSSFPCRRRIEDPPEERFIGLTFHIVRCFMDEQGVERDQRVVAHQFKVFKFGDFSSPTICNWITHPLILAGVPENSIEDIKLGVSSKARSILKDETNDQFIVTSLSLSVQVYANWEEEVAAASYYVPKPNPAAEESIRALKRVKVEVGGGEKVEKDCSICLEAFSEGMEVVRMPCCSKAFHGECIEKWLNQSYTCPLCRFPMPARSE